MPSAVPSPVRAPPQGPPRRRFDRALLTTAAARFTFKERSRETIILGRLWQPLPVPVRRGGVFVCA